MPNLLGTEELKKALGFEYSRKSTLQASREMREFNINAFCELSREGLEYGKRERKICLYETLNGEKIYIQYPGKESADRRQIMPLDFRPELQMTNGKFISPVSFGDIWDILSALGENQKKELQFVASLFLKIGYMHDYLKYQGKYEFVDVEMTDSSIKQRGCIDFEWFMLNLSDDIWFTLNDRIGEVKISETEKFSFEAFIKFVDLLFQNEDCKYYYKNVIIDGKKDYKLTSGRTSSSEANLLIINHLEGYTKLSELLNAFQKSRGVPGFKKTDYTVVTNGMVLNIDVEGRNDKEV